MKSLSRNQVTIGASAAGWAAATLLLALSTACASVPPRPMWEDVTFAATGRGVYPDGVSEAQARLMAERAARADGYRKLTEQVYGVALSASTTVRDQVLSDDRIETQFDGFIRRARVLDTRRSSDVGIVEIDMQLTLDDDFLRVLGWRAPERGSRQLRTALRPRQDRPIRATGRGLYPDGGNPAQARLMAERAARVDAHRKLAERMHGVGVRRRFNDGHIAVVRGFVRGARVADVRRFPEDGFVEIDMEISLPGTFRPR